MHLKIVKEAATVTALVETQYIVTEQKEIIFEYRVIINCFWLTCPLSSSWPLEICLC